MARCDRIAITVFFDGQCPVCSREVAVYRRLAPPGSVLWRDLTGPGEVWRSETFTLAAALELLHVKDAGGILHVGLNAHLLMWDELPLMRWVSRLLRRWPAARTPVEAMYLAFTKRRPGLVRRRSQPETGRG